MLYHHISLVSMNMMIIWVLIDQIDSINGVPVTWDHLCQIFPQGWSNLRSIATDLVSISGALRSVARSVAASDPFCYYTIGSDHKYLRPIATHWDRSQDRSQPRRPWNHLLGSVAWSWSRSQGPETGRWMGFTTREIWNRSFSFWYRSQLWDR